MFSTGELDAKRLEFMSEIVAGASIFGVLVNPKYPPAKNQARELETAATKVGRTIYGVEASDDAQLETAFAALLQKGVAALVVASDPFSIHGASASFLSRRKTACPAFTNSEIMHSTAASSVTAPASRTHIVK